MGILLEVVEVWKRTTESMVESVQGIVTCLCLASWSYITKLSDLRQFLVSGVRSLMNARLSFQASDGHIKPELIHVVLCKGAA